MIRTGLLSVSVLLIHFALAGPLNVCNELLHLVQCFLKGKDVAELNMHYALKTMTECFP